jgi:hypothetical protein
VQPGPAAFGRTGSTAGASGDFRGSSVTQLQALRRRPFLNLAMGLGLIALGHTIRRRIERIASGRSSGPTDPHCGREGGNSPPHPWHWNVLKVCSPKSVIKDSRVRDAMIALRYMRPPSRYPSRHECPTNVPKLANPFLSRTDNKSLSAVIVLMR